MNQLRIEFGYMEWKMKDIMTSRPQHTFRNKNIKKLPNLTLLC